MATIGILEFPIDAIVVSKVYHILAFVVFDRMFHLIQMAARMGGSSTKDGNQTRTTFRPRDFKTRN